MANDNGTTGHSIGTVSNLGGLTILQLESLPEDSTVNVKTGSKIQVYKLNKAALKEGGDPSQAWQAVGDQYDDPTDLQAADMAKAYAQALKNNIVSVPVPGLPGGSVSAWLNKDKDGNVIMKDDGSGHQVPDLTIIDPTANDDPSTKTGMQQAMDATVAKLRADAKSGDATAQETLAKIAPSIGLITAQTGQANATTGQINANTTKTALDVLQTGKGALNTYTDQIANSNYPFEAKLQLINGAIQKQLNEDSEAISQSQAITSFNEAKVNLANSTRSTIGSFMGNAMQLGQGLATHGGFGVDFASLMKAAPTMFSQPDLKDPQSPFAKSSGFISDLDQARFSQDKGSGSSGSSTTGGGSSSTTKPGGGTTPNGQPASTLNPVLDPTTGQPVPFTQTGPGGQGTVSGPVTNGFMQTGPGGQGTVVGGAVNALNTAGNTSTPIMTPTTDPLGSLKFGTNPAVTSLGLDTTGGFSNQEPNYVPNTMNGDDLGIRSNNPAADQFNYPQPDYGLQSRALGGPLAAGQPSIVGERGPELVVPQQPVNVIPNSALTQAQPQGSFMQTMQQNRPMPQRMPSHPIRPQDARNILQLVNGGMKLPEAVLVAHTLAGGDPHLLHSATFGIGM